MKRRGPGRPPKPRALKYSERVTVWLTRSELARVEAAAKAAGITTSQLLMIQWRKGD
jgi:hypothetical protein